MLENVITYQDEKLDVTLTVVGPATVLAGMKRAVLIGRALSYTDALDEETVDAAARRFAARTLYPDLLAATREAEGLDLEMDVEDFFALPEALTDAWQNAVYELNPAWYPFRRDEEEAEKKEAGNDSSASG